jgi:hypothetical protein
MNMEKEERKNEYDSLLSKIEEGIEDHALKCLFKCFYQPLDFDKTEHCNTLNTGLNLFFFGKGIHKHEKWQNGFKSSIKEKYQSSNGKFKLKDPSQNIKEIINQLEADDFIKAAKNKWVDIKKALDSYFEELIKAGGAEKTLIYEAPPYLLSINNINDITFEAEFIFDEGCSSPYVNAIRNGLDSEPKDSVKDILVKNKVGFFDVIPIPIPINSDLRKEWATADKFKIDEKRIFIYFIEWALIIYKFKIQPKSIENHKLAIGIPLKNAITLYESPDIMGVKKICEPHQFDLDNIKPVGLWVQPYKNCIIGSSNTPSGDLLKIAFQ